MSIAGLNWCIKQKTDTPTTKLVLFILSNYADENHSCYPSEKKLAELVGVSDRQIRRCITSLVNDGLISIETRKGTSNRYYLGMDTDVQTLRTPTSSNTKEDTKDKYNDDFLKFWETYPRKINKYAALQSFKRAIKNDDLQTIMNAVAIFAKNNQATEERFIPHAQTWLNQKRYLDLKEKTKKISLNNIAG